MDAQDPLDAYGWGPRWAALLADVARDASPGRVVRHDGDALMVATREGTVRAVLSTRLSPQPTVGDWVALRDGAAVAVLPRTSLLRRRVAGEDDEQPLAANVDVAFLVCGLDRPLRAGRIQRGVVLAWDAGAVPVVVLTKAATVDDAAAAVEAAHAADPTLDVVVTSVLEGVGLDELRAIARGRTVTLLGESGAGKSSIVNALVGGSVALTAVVRAGDAKGRHTTTARELHLLPTGGTLIDTPGIREVGLWTGPEAVDGSFADVDELASGCRFPDCAHDREPGCAVRAAVDAGTLDGARVDAWRRLRREAEAAALRATPHELRRRDKRFARIVKDAQRRKGR